MKCFHSTMLAFLASVLLGAHATLADNTQDQPSPPSPLSPSLTPALPLLSIPNFVSEQEQKARAAGIQVIAGQIVNEKRTWRIDDTEYPFYDGPVARPGSLAQQIQQQQVVQLTKFSNPNISAVTQTALRASFDTASDYDRFYANLLNIASTPMSFDASDGSFGYQRMTIKGFNLRAFQIGTDTLPIDPSLTVANNVAKVCGAKVTRLQLAALNNKLFVVDFSSFGQWNQPLDVTGGKFVAPVIGYFCYNEERSKLLPLAIRIVDTKVTYTPFDRAEEWTLAKMALDAAEISFQQVHHIIDTHALLAPVQIETLRNLAPAHPVSALLLRVSNVDFGIEPFAAQLLFNTSTLLDRTFGFGAVGSVRLLDHQLQFLSIENDFDDDVRRRGLAHLPIHKYARYGKLYSNALAKVVGAYLAAFYPTDSAVTNDVELQSWAAACAKVGHLRAFPKRFTTIQALQKVLTHLLFRTMVRHHAMNGVVTWETISVPYSTPALWKQLPTRKLTANETLDVLAFSTPKQLVPALMTLAVSFKRDVPASESLFSLFAAPLFANEPKLTNVIVDFQASLQSIERIIATNEREEKQPYNLLRPTMLPYNAWV